MYIAIQVIVLFQWKYILEDPESINQKTKRWNNNNSPQPMGRNRHGCSKTGSENNSRNTIGAVKVDVPEVEVERGIVVELMKMSVKRAGPVSH